VTVVDVGVVEIGVCVQTETASRLLAGSQAVLLIVYTPGPDAEANGYEPWLVKTDNPFFNAIPGVQHYANWKIERILHGAPPGYTHFDFQGLTAASDLERVWFNPSLDAFRTEWIRLWGYGGSSPAQANAYLMHPTPAQGGSPTAFACITAGLGTAPGDADIAWQVSETIRKHFASSGGKAAWRIPIASDNPLGFDWVAVRYGSSLEALAAEYRPGGETAAWLARLIAAP
jgi:hypothetical protein